MAVLHLGPMGTIDGNHVRIRIELDGQPLLDMTATEAALSWLAGGASPRSTGLELVAGEELRWADEDGPHLIRGWSAVVQTDCG